MGAALALAVPLLVAALMPRGSSAADTRAAQQQTEDVSRQLREINAKKKAAEEAFQKLNKEKEQLEKGDIESYKKNMDNFFDREIQAIEKLPDLAKKENFSVAVMGFTSTGKSSLLNKVFGLNLKVSPLRCTTGAERVGENHGIDVYDVFGENCEESYHNMQVLLQAKTIHTIIVVYTDCIDTSFQMAKLMRALKVDTVFFRNKSEDLTPDEAKQVQAADEKTLQDKAGLQSQVIVGSAKNGMGCDELLDLLTEQRASVEPAARRRRVA